MFYALFYCCFVKLCVVILMLFPQVGKALTKKLLEPQHKLETYRLESVTLEF